MREVTCTARTGRHAYLTITYIATDERFPLPFGADRSLLAWITTKAFDDGWVTFTAITEYFRAFNLDTGGRGYKLFRERFQRIANLAIRLETWEEHERHVQRFFLLPVTHEPTELLSGGEGELDLSRKLLTDRHYGFRLAPPSRSSSAPTASPPPLRLLRAFHNAPQAWDFAQLLVYRSYVAKEPTVIPWADLLVQLGANDRDYRRLRHRLGEAPEEIRRLYPECPARLRGGLRGLEIRPWQPAGRGSRQGQRRLELTS